MSRVNKVADLKITLEGVDSFIGAKVEKTKTTCVCVDAITGYNGVQLSVWECTYLPTGDKMVKHCTNPLYVSQLPTTYQSFLNYRKRERAKPATPKEE